MSHRIRALVIAPYEGMKYLMASLQEEYLQIELTLFVGARMRAWKLPAATSMATMMWGLHG